MKKELIAELFVQFEHAAYDYKGIECWSARELQSILEYTKWDNFYKVIEKAKIACETSGSSTSDHFADTGKMIDLANGAKREIDEIALSRYACYLIAQNGDASKPSIAFAQTYFAVQTRKQEIIEKRLLDIDRVTARDKLSQSEKRLSSILFERGVDGDSFALIKSKGDQALFGGYSTNDMKHKLGVAANRPLADFLPTLTIKAKDFANELTSHNVVDKNVKGKQPITKEHTDNNLAVRKILKQRGIQPEKLPAAEDLKKISRRLNSEDKKVPQTFKRK